MQFVDALMLMGSTGWITVGVDSCQYKRLQSKVPMSFIVAGGEEFELGLVTTISQKRDCELASVCRPVSHTPTAKFNAMLLFNGHKLLQLLT